MTASDWLAAVVQGVVEGLTEFLPVSSTAHVRLTQHALGFADPGQLFTVVIQLGAILAVVVACRERLAAMVMGTLRGDPVQRRFVLALAIACVPAAGIGLLANRWLETHVFGAWELAIIAFTLGLGGLLILIIERWHPKPRHVDAGALPLRTAIGIGLIQVLALIPGVSRSGACIMGAMCLGVERRAATEFSFLLAIPVMAGASGLKLVKHRDQLTADYLPVLLLGSAVSFITALIAVRWLLRWVSTRTFAPFAWYRIALGCLIAGLLLAGVIPVGQAR